ncbi:MULTISPECIES: MAPEG family protein [Rhodanobacter]|uniref:MAPEG family protein n=1 Tax=Rhodanobacter TaxID=75309 RepID=UPI0004294D0D|nr:MAPEG family protein [Rhodanobacter thiooxydans]UJJ54108.1 MAPEG family protein [Rhodanobacter thiooxydans]
MNASWYDSIAPAGNLLKTFPLFAAVVLVGYALQHHDGMTALSAQLYLLAWLAYVPAYAAGIPTCAR